MEIEGIVNKLNEAKDTYYNLGRSIITDDEFDKLEEELLALDPENKYFSEVGMVNKKNKITHPVPMLSMGKSKDIPGILKWLERLALDSSLSYIIEPKIDGLSATCKYSNGKLQYVATRGNGEVGQDITYISKYMNDVKETISFTRDDIEIRGELYLPKSSVLNKDDKALRNICAGLINRKEKREDLKHVKFAVFQISGLTGYDLESDKIELLKDNQFNTVNYAEAFSVDEIETFYKKYIQYYRDDWEFETDGIIISVNDSSLFEEIDKRWVVSHHHHYAIALKAPAENSTTSLLDIAWQISRQGNIVPVAIFESVTIGGANITRATLHNFENVIKLRINKGDSLLIERANDVIPYIKENLDYNSNDDDYSSELIPEECPSCSSKLEKSGVHLKCFNLDCNEQKIQQIVFWIKKMEFDQVAEASIRILYEKNKINSVVDLYKLAEKNFEGIEGFAEKKINNFLNEIEKSRDITFSELIAGIGIPLLQERALKKININSINDFIEFNDDTYIIGKNIIKWKKDEKNMQFLNNLIEVLDVQDTIVVEFKGKVAMTGKGPESRKDLIAKIKLMGYDFKDSITKDIDILICEDRDSNSSKIKKARKNNIEIVTYKNFFN